MGIDKLFLFFFSVLYRCPLSHIYDILRAMNEKTKCENPWLCTALGFFLPLLGLIIGAIIGKGDGVKHALGGIVLRWVLIIGGCLWFCSSVEEAVEKAEERRTTRQSEASKAWEVTAKKSPIDDSTTYTVSIAATAPVRGGFDKSPPVLILRNEEGKSEAFISWPMYIGSRKTAVTIRFDDEAALTDDWTCSTDGRAVFAPFPFADFFDLLKEAKRLVVRLTPYGESPETATFNVSGLSNIDAAALEALGNSKE